MGKPLVFIASSSEGKAVAEAISQNLRDVCECKVWSNGMFETGNFYLETLLNDLPEFDFAVMAMTNDDKIVSRGNDYNSPRDNVLFELGMYIGSLGRKRTFVVLDKSAKLKLPSDLAGLTMGSFEPPERITMRDAVSDACIDIKSAINELGLRNPLAPEKVEDKNCFPKDITIIEDVASVLQMHVLPIIERVVSARGSITIKNFGLDLENVMVWLKDRVNMGDFAGAAVSFKCLIVNPESPYVKNLLGRGSNISAKAVTNSIETAREFADMTELSSFELEMRQYDLAPIIHGFIIDDAHMFLGFTEIKNGKLIGGIKPYIYLNKQQYNSSLIAQHYFTSFNGWFDSYWNISNAVVNVKK